jgi:DNA modification methylase
MNPVIIGNATLYHADCRDVLPMLTGVNAIITDPPYFLTDLALDKNSDSIDWRLLSKCIQSNGYLAVFGQDKMKRGIDDYWELRFDGVWLKQSPTMRTHSAKKPGGMFEPYAVYATKNYVCSELVWNKVKLPGEKYKKVQRRSGYKRGGKDSLDRGGSNGWTEDGFISENDGFRYASDVLFGNNKTGMPHHDRTDHPTQKPIEVMEVLVQWLTNSGDLILDPYMGSASTGVAALKHNRKFIGIEVEKKYFEIACERIDNAQRQQVMF